MSTDVDRELVSTLTPEEAFAVLGDETRLQILHVLGSANRPLSFSTLFDEVDYETSANFSYHLDKLVGHFVRETDEGYELGQVGTRVIQAVLSGTVTEAPTIERTPSDRRCEFCGAQTEISYSQGILGLYCTECSSPATESWPSEYDGFIRGYPFPPAGLEERSATEILRMAALQGRLKELSIANGICPHCSASLDYSITVCEDHDEGDFCEECARRFPVLVNRRCENCILEAGIRLRTLLLSNIEVLAFVTSRGIHPFAREGELLLAVETEEVVTNPDPFEARVTFTIGSEAISVTVDEDLSVVNVTERKMADAG